MVEASVELLVCGLLNDINKQQILKCAARARPRNQLQHVEEGKKKQLPQTNEVGVSAYSDVPEG